MIVDCRSAVLSSSSQHNAVTAENVAKTAANIPDVPDPEASRRARSIFRFIPVRLIRSICVAGRDKSSRQIECKLQINCSPTRHLRGMQLL